MDLLTATVDFLEIFIIYLLFNFVMFYLNFIWLFSKWLKHVGKNDFNYIFMLKTYFMINKVA